MNDENTVQAAQQLKTRVSAERALVAALDGKLTQPSMKEYLKRASYSLDDVEGILSGVENSLTPWILLQGAETFLGIAVQQRQGIEAIVAKYGHDAVFI